MTVARILHHPRRLAICVAVVLAASTLATPSSATQHDRSARPAAKVTLDDRALTRAGTWRSITRANAYRGTLSKSRQRGATLTSPTTTTAGGSVRFEGGPRRGRLQVWVGGVLQKSVRTARATRTFVTVAFGGTGAVVLKVARPRRGVLIDKVRVTPPPPPPAPRVGEVVITELMADPAGTNDHPKEWFELTSVASGTVSLGGCQVGDGVSTSSLSAFTMAPGAITLIAGSADPTQNAGLPVVAATFPFALPDANVKVSLTCSGTLVDETATFATPVAGQSFGLSSDSTSATGNDASGHWCGAMTTYGTEGDLGTPGSANPICP